MIFGLGKHQFKKNYVLYGLTRDVLPKIEDGPNTCFDFEIEEYQKLQQNKLYNLAEFADRRTALLCHGKLTEMIFQYELEFTTCPFQELIIRDIELPEGEQDICTCTIPDLDKIDILFPKKVN